MAATVLATGSPVTASAAESGARDGAPVQLTLPAPTGSHPIGTVALHLMDYSRQDPWIAPSRVRELMVSLWYPARDTSRYPVAPWLPPAAAAHYMDSNGLPTGRIRLPDTHGREGAPVDRRAGRLPVVLFSPGSYADRSSNTVVVEELASHGYLVVTIDHTHDASDVEFPGGRVETNTMARMTPGKEQVKVRAADIRFVLDQLSLLDVGTNPDAERRKLPVGLPGALDLHRIGMFGTSMGGATTATAMLTDQRIKAGLSLDGPVFGDVVTAGLDRPFMLISAKINRIDFPDLATFWSRLRDWRLHLTVRGAGHLSYSDLEVLIPQVAPLIPLPADLTEAIGTVDPARAVAVQQAYPLAFFDRQLRHRGHLLEHPSPCFPEVTIVD
jgi:predicted dienelactone hydrolase